MREVMQQAQHVSKLARLRRARLSIAVVYPGRDRRLSVKRIGMVHGIRTAPSDDTTLYEMGFRRGDFLDLSILV